MLEVGGGVDQTNTQRTDFRWHPGKKTKTLNLLIKGEDSPKGYVLGHHLKERWYSMPFRAETLTTASQQSKKGQNGCARYSYNTPKTAGKTEGTYARQETKTSKKGETLV